MAIETVKDTRQVLAQQNSIFGKPRNEKLEFYDGVNIQTCNVSDREVVSLIRNAETKFIEVFRTECPELSCAASPRRTVLGAAKIFVGDVPDLLKEIGVDWRFPHFEISIKIVDYTALESYQFSGRFLSVRLDVPKINGPMTRYVHAVRAAILKFMNSLYELDATAATIFVSQDRAPISLR